MQNSIEINVTAVLDELVKKYRDKLNLVTWTSVEDRLPEDGVHVLAFDDDIAIAYYNGYEWYEVGFYGCINPTHWMPLPELPEKKETKSD